MRLGFGLGLTFYDRPATGGGGGGGGGTARSATDYFVRTTGPTTYPPLVDFNRMVDWVDGDQLVCQRSQDATFATGTSETIVTLAYGTVTYNLGLGGIASGSWFFRIAAWSGTRPGSLNWSAILNVGDVTAPTITSSATQSTSSIALTADEGVTWAIVGGADAALWQISGSTLSLINPVVTQSVHAVQVQATDYAGLTSSVQSITVTIDITPTAFTFTDITGATASTQYTSNTITIAGLGSGVTVAVSGGPYQKNGAGGYTSAATTAVNGDTFSMRVTSSSTGGAGVGASLTVGTYSDTYTVTTTGFVPGDLWLATESGDWWDVSDLSTMFQDTAGTTPVTVANGSQMVKRWVGKKNGTVLVPNSTNGPTLNNDGTFNYLNFTNAGAVNQSLSIASMQVVDATTGVWTTAYAASPPDTTTRTILLHDNGTTQRGISITQGTDVSARAAGTGFYTDAAGATVVANTPYTHIAVRDLTTVESFYNNTGNGSTATSGTTPKGTASLLISTTGGSYYLAKIYGAVVVIGRAINSTERGNLHTWLDARS